MYKVIGFDLDGTIIDSDEVIIETWVELFKLYKPKDFIIDREHIRTYSGPSIDYAINDAFPEFSYDFVYNEYRARAKKYYDTPLLKIFPDCKEVLEKLKKDGYKLALITCKNEERTIFCLKKYKIFDLFDLILTMDNLEKPKPSPICIEKTLEHFNISKDEFLYVGDSNNDFYTCKNSNVDSILLTMAKRNLNEDVKPLKFINSYKELLNYIESKN